MKNREQFLKEMSDQLKQWDNELKGLTGNIKESSSATGNKVDDRVFRLRINMEELKNKILEASTVTEEIWNTFKNGLVNSHRQIYHEIEKLRSDKK